jgi:beta-lactam-binding protein with PASTA domain
MSGSLFNFLRSKRFRYHLLAALLVTIASFLFLQQWLNGFTRHGESIEVPALLGMKLEKMQSLLEESGLAFEIVDSLYETGKDPGTVIDQDPAPKSLVKKGRTIYLTVNAAKPPKVKMPDLTDVSQRQAEAILESFGLKVGRITFEPDLAKNAVLKQLYRGSPIAPGREIYKGSSIDLVLGDGMGAVEVPVPDLTGLTKAEALLVLQGASLSAGNINFDPGVKDTLNATIYLQSPESSEGSFLLQGSAVDFYLH